MPVKIDKVYFENGKCLRFPKYSVKAYAPSPGSGFTITVDTLEQVVSCVNHFYGQHTTRTHHQGCLVCLYINSEGKTTEKITTIDLAKLRRRKFDAD